MCKMVKLPDVVMVSEETCHILPMTDCGNLTHVNQQQYTAVMYMKRFFLNNTVMDYHPKDVLYVACTFSNQYVLLDLIATFKQIYLLVLGHQS